MIKRYLTDDEIIEAKRLYDFKKLNNSITEGQSQIYGALGEVMVMNFFKLYYENVEYVGSYDFDIKINGKKIDVKTIKTDKEPTKDFNANISAFNITQKTDFYLWCSVAENMKYGYIIGYLEKDEFYKIAQLKKKGEIDWGNWVFKSDTYTTQIKNIKTFGI